MVAIKSGDEAGLLAAVASVGPVSVAMDGRNKAFRVYIQEVFFLWFTESLFPPLTL